MPSHRFIFVEGKIDKEILISLLATEVSLSGEQFTVHRRGYKNTLAIEAQAVAKQIKENVYFVRDRDFDYPPPDNFLQSKQIKAEVITITHPNQQKIN